MIVRNQIFRRGGSEIPLGSFSAHGNGEELRSLSAIVRDELRGLYHGSLVVLDNGSSLANRGMIRIVDDEGTSFDSFLHEIGFQIYDEDDRT